MITINAGDKCANEQDFCDWLRMVGVTPENCFKIELKDEEVVAYNYSTDEEGKKFVVDGEIAKDDPMILPGVSLPVWIAEKLELKED